MSFGVTKYCDPLLFKEKICFSDCLRQFLRANTTLPHRLQRWKNRSIGIDMHLDFRVQTNLTHGLQKEKLNGGIAPPNLKGF